MGCTQNRIYLFSSSLIAHTKKAPLNTFNTAPKLWSCVKLSASPGPFWGAASLIDAMEAYQPSSSGFDSSTGLSVFPLETLNILSVCVCVYKKQ